MYIGVRYTCVHWCDQIRYFNFQRIQHFHLFLIRQCISAAFNFIPDDSSRVALTVPNSLGTDYINASYLDVSTCSTQIHVSPDEIDTYVTPYVYSTYVHIIAQQCVRTYILSTCTVHTLYIHTYVRNSYILAW